MRGGKASRNKNHLWWRKEFAMTRIDTESSVNSLVEMLTREVNFRIGIDWITGLVGLMRELIKAKAEPNLSNKDRRAIYSLGERVKARIIDLAKKNTDRLCNDWQIGDRISPLYLKSERDNYKALSTEVFPPELWKTFRECAKRIQEALDWGSEQRAHYLILGVENSISMAEEILTNNEFTDSNLEAADANLSNARAGFREIEEKTHIRTVGLSRVAKKREISVEKLLADLKDREKNARIYLETLDAQAEKKRLEKLQTEQRWYNQEFVKQAQSARETKIEQTIRAMELRSKTASEAAREFLEHVKSRNPGKANACLVVIKRCEGGVPPMLQELYGELLRTR